MHIIVGITGGIAAYKTPELVRLLVKAGHEVRCAVTEHALQFTTRATLETVSSNPLYSDLFAGNDHGTEHISLKDWADWMIVAPATANCIGKMANGIADDALSTLLLAMPTQRVLLAPAMNSQMWNHPSVQHNLEVLHQWGVHTIGPESGALACGTDGVGRMAEPVAIADKIRDLAASSTTITPQRRLANQRWLVTAGPTYERIDSVRFIGNYSSGKMGYALAEALAKAGAEVELVSGPTALGDIDSPNVNITRIESAREMYEAATRLFPSCHGAILSAAVADYRPESTADHKLKKQGDKGMTLHLVQNPDILATLGSMKGTGQTLVGFALETDNEMANATGKLQRKHLDYIVMNSLRDAGAGFGFDTNKVSIIAADGQITESPLLSKKEIAELIINTVTN